MNAVLEKQGVGERIDHRSYERQGLEQIPTVHMGVAASQMEQRGIVTERGNQNREIVAKNGLLRQLMTKIKQLKDWLKEALSLTVDNTKAEKPSVMAQLEKYKKVVVETKKSEPSALTHLYECFDISLKKLKQVDARLKSANGAAEYDKILPERHKAYAEYSALKAQVKNAEKQTKNLKRVTRSKNYYER